MKTHVASTALRLLALAATTALSFSQTAPSPPTDATVLPEFQVNTSKQLDTYVASEAISGTRTGAKILELPYDVEVLTKEFIEDFRLYEQDDQMKFVANFTPRDPDSGTGGGAARARRRAHRAGVGGCVGAIVWLEVRRTR
jgi:hypothetical protein